MSQAGQRGEQLLLEPWRSVLQPAQPASLSSSAAQPDSLSAAAASASVAAAAAAAASAGPFGPGLDA